MVERRYYDRLQVKIDAVLYKFGEELACTIIDINETGFCLEVEKDKAMGLCVQDSITILFKDRYQIVDKNLTELGQYRATILHIDTIEDKLHIGCYVHNIKYDNYIRQRKFADYLLNYRI